MPRHPSPRVVLTGFAAGSIGLLLVGLRTLPSSMPRPANEESEALTVARKLVGPELERRRVRLERENRKEACTNAQSFVCARLLPAFARAAFPESPPSAITVTRLRPYFYWVRAHVIWHDQNGIERDQPLETDLKQGPTDSDWHLIDTEFLPQKVRK
jgi:hypothetical protein